MLDTPTARRLHKIAHSKRAKNFNLRHGMLTISVSTGYSVCISDNMRAALVMTLLVLIALSGVLSLRLTPSPKFCVANPMEFSNAELSTTLYRILDTEGGRPSCSGICDAFTIRHRATESSTAREMIEPRLQW
jgi:hypothetical protein